MKSFATVESSLNLEKTYLLLATLSALALVIKGSTPLLSSLALGSVVLLSHEEIVS